jgi:hypothetical protein
MTDHPISDTQSPELPEEERARIRAEMRYALLVAQETRPSEKPKTVAEKLLGYLSNGFVLLLLGSLITSYLVPQFQRGYESRTRQTSLMQECLAQFLLYSNSIWQEYYAVLPITLQTDMDKDEYVRYMNEISQIKLKRYDAFSKVQALALVFREDGANATPPVETALTNYAVRVNAVSAAIDKWLSNIYCTPTKRERSPCATFDPTFDAYNQYLTIQQLVLDVGNESAQQVAELMVERIKFSR